MQTNGVQVGNIMSPPSTTVETNRMHVDYFLPRATTAVDTKGVYADVFLFPPPAALLTNISLYVANTLGRST